MDKSSNFSALIILCLKEALISWGANIYIIIIYWVKTFVRQRDIKVFVFWFQNSFELHVQGKVKRKYISGAIREKSHVIFEIV